MTFFPFLLRPSKSSKKHYALFGKYHNNLLASLIWWNVNKFSITSKKTGFIKKAGFISQQIAKDMIYLTLFTARGVGHQHPCYIFQSCFNKDEANGLNTWWQFNSKSFWCLKKDFTKFPIHFFWKFWISNWQVKIFCKIFIFQAVFVQFS